MGLGLWCRAVNLSAEAGTAGFVGRRQLASGLAYFGTRSPAWPVEAAAAAVGSAAGTAAAPWGYSVAASVRAEPEVGFETPQQVVPDWMSPLRR